MYAGIRKTFESATICKLVRTKHVDRQSAKAIQREAGDINIFWWSLEKGFLQKGPLVL